MYIHYWLPALMGWCPLLLVYVYIQSCLPALRGWCPLQLVDVHMYIHYCLPKSTTAFWCINTVLLASLKRILPTTACWCIRYWLPTLMDWWVNVNYCLPASMGWFPLVLDAISGLMPSFFVGVYTTLASINGLMSTTDWWHLWVDVYYWEFSFHQRIFH